MRVLALIALGCGCATAGEAEMPIDGSLHGSVSELDRLGFIDGCWYEEIPRGFAASYQLCWSREPDRWRGSFKMRPRGRREPQVTDYVIRETTDGIVLEYDTQGTPQRVQASRVGPDVIEFRRPDSPGRMWRGADLSLHYNSPTKQLWASVFDVLYTFARAGLEPEGSVRAHQG